MLEGLKFLSTALTIIVLLVFSAQYTSAVCDTKVYCTSFGDDHCTVCDSNCASNFCPAAPGTCVPGTYGTLAGECSGRSQANDAYCSSITVPGGKWCEQWQGCCVVGGAVPTPTPGGGGPGCTTGTWTNQDCGGTYGALTCAPNQMLRTRTVNPAGCTNAAECVPNYPACTGVPSSCSFDVNDITLNGTGDSLPNTLYNVVESGSTVSEVTFTPFDPSIVGVTSPDTISPYSTTVTAKTTGTTSVLVRATMNNAVFCQNIFDVTISNPTAWFQSGSGDMIAGAGNVSSQIPAVCTDPVTCVLITGTSNLNPGVVQAGGSISSGNGEYSQPDPPYNWSVPNSPHAGNNYDYEFFETRTESKSFEMSPNPSLSNGTPDWAGYKWLKSSGSFTIPADVDLGTNKVILFVNGDLNINGKIDLTPGRGFFMAVVNGNVNVKGSVGGPADTTPDLQGLFFVNQTFNSAVTDPAPQQQLHVQGTVVANAFSLTRSLSDNSQTPAELFEFSPALLLQLPASLGSRQVIWKEVAP